jgi:hypothetical protein
LQYIKLDTNHRRGWFSGSRNREALALMKADWPTTERRTQPVVLSERVRESAVASSPYLWRCKRIGGGGVSTQAQRNAPP